MRDYLEAVQDTPAAFRREVKLAHDRRFYRLSRLRPLGPDHGEPQGPGSVGLSDVEGEQRRRASEAPGCP